jgi:hypothetical protein
MASEQEREKYTRDKKNSVSYVNDKMDKRRAKTRNESALRIRRRKRKKEKRDKSPHKTRDASDRIARPVRPVSSNWSRPNILHPIYNPNPIAQRNPRES